MGVIMVKKPSKSAQLAALLPQELYDRLNAGAARKGISMGEETRRLLETAVKIEDREEGPTGDLLAGVAHLAADVEKLTKVAYLADTGKPWWGDPFGFAMLQAGVLMLLKRHQPEGEAPAGPHEDSLASVLYSPTMTATQIGEMRAKEWLHAQGKLTRPAGKAKRQSMAKG